MPRLDALLALNLGCSKTKAREALAEGRVRGADGAALVDARAEIPLASLPFPVTFDEAPITLVGGAYHEVRRIFAALDSHVLALCRVSFGRLALPRDLAAGAWRAIAPTDV